MLIPCCSDRLTLELRGRYVKWRQIAQLAGAHTGCRVNQGIHLLFGHSLTFQAHIAHGLDFFIRRRTRPALRPLRLRGMHSLAERTRILRPVAQGLQLGSLSFGHIHKKQHKHTQQGNGDKRQNDE